MNIADSFFHAAKCYPEKKALICGNRSYTYSEMNRIIDGVAGYLIRQGLSRGSRLALFMANSPEWILLYYGAARMGAVPVCVPGAYKKDEVRGVLNDSRPSILVASESLSPQIPAPPEIARIEKTVRVESDDSLQSILRESGAGARPIASDTTGNDPGSILYTGGTTGIPKGAVLTHRNLLYSAQNVAYHERMVPEDVGVCFMPLNHVFAQCHIMNTYFTSCATLVLFPAFDMDGVMAAVQEHKVTRFYAVPTIFIRILNAAETRKQLRSLRYAFSGGTSMPSEIVRRWMDAFGIPIHEAYGMTEAASCVTFNHLFRHKIGSIGTPAGIVEVKVVDAEDREVKQGEQGEIVVRGPNIMKEYFEQPEETAAALRNGWFHSGDVGLFDGEGYLYIVDRIKDVIITGGENVYPKEVEDLLHQHKAVNECGVVGLPHHEYGEAVTAFVSLKPGMTADEKELIAFCKERIANYKVPKSIRFVADLPKSPQGKILRRALRK
ncbi:MAG: AMP-binding protein, partial [Acidobacteria bacterium]|nr:AMP-binding protein [Acidobacteriota bacterium]